MYIDIRSSKNAHFATIYNDNKYVNVRVLISTVVYDMNQKLKEVKMKGNNIELKHSYT